MYAASAHIAILGHADPGVAELVGRYITVAEAAEYLQISDRTVRRLIRDGELSGYRMA